jgi:hypothetical protein
VRTWLAVAAVIVLPACTGTQPVGGPDLLAVYNPAVDNGDVIVCKRIATGTRVLRNVCLPQRQWDKIHDESLEYLVRNDAEVRRR